MGRCIVKLDGHYLEWSSVVDAPVTHGMSRVEFEAYVRDEYGAQGLRDLPARLARADETGTSTARRESADETIWLNRAGKGETWLTRSQFVDYYVTRRGRGPKPVGVAPDPETDDDPRISFEKFVGG